uniref:Uncharacterized protein n=1 Tax=Zooxanthella nutricula TaxID=1333877 RepID=A0A7S2QR03_9DINO
MGWGADKPFVFKEVIRRWKARFPHWPPSDASPVTPIEPWGKQFFVYNAPAGVELRGDPRAPPLDDLRPRWVRDEIAAGMLRDGEDLSALPLGGPPPNIFQQRAAARGARPGHETVLCATDYRQRPLLYLRPEEWSEFLRQLPRLKEQLRARQAEIDEQDEKGAAMREYALRRVHVLDKHESKQVGRMGGGRPYFSGKIPPKTRERMTPTVKTELARYGSQGAAE